MSARILRSVRTWIKNCQYRSVMILVLLGATALGGWLIIADGKLASTPVRTLERGTYGEGSRKQSFRVLIDGKEKEDQMEIIIGERQYSSEELEIVFEDAYELLEKEMLGENESLNAVYHNLNLTTEIEGQPLEVSWETDRYDLVSVYGELNEKNLESETDGVLVTLRAYLFYTEDDSVKSMKEMTARVFPPKLSKEESEIALVQDAIEETESENKQEKTISVPEDVEGKQVELRNPRNARGWAVLLLGPVVCVLLVALQKQNEEQERRERGEQMRRDYPEIINKLTLLLGAGMTVKSAWNKIVKDYEEQKETRGFRFAYEEMAIACREMQSGITEAESYENFGRRCELKEYRKLSALLSQNLRKGTKGITDLLMTESMQAFEERKAIAKRKGEEAGTKLLGPMFLMLSMVLVIVIVPAFLSVQL